MTWHQHPFPSVHTLSQNKYSFNFLQATNSAVNLLTIFIFSMPHSNHNFLQTTDEAPTKLGHHSHPTKPEVGGSLSHTVPFSPFINISPSFVVARMWEGTEGLSFEQHFSITIFNLHSHVSPLLYYPYGRYLYVRGWGRKKDACQPQAEKNPSDRFPERLWEVEQDGRFSALTHSRYHSSKKIHLREALHGFPHQLDRVAEPFYLCRWIAAWPNFHDGGWASSPPAHDMARFSDAPLYTLNTTGTRRRFPEDSPIPSVFPLQTVELTAHSRCR